MEGEQGKPNGKLVKLDTDEERLRECSRLFDNHEDVVQGEGHYVSVTI